MPQNYGRRSWVVGPGNGLADGHAPGPGSHRGTDGLRIDTANHERRQRRLRRRLADKIEAGERRELLGARRKCRPDADIACPIQHCLPQLIEIVRAHADQGVEPQQTAGILHRQVFLSQVNAIRLDQASDVGPIVDDEQHPRLSRPVSHLTGTLQ